MSEPRTLQTDKILQSSAKSDEVTLLSHCGTAEPRAHKMNYTTSYRLQLTTGLQTSYKAAFVRVWKVYQKDSAYHKGSRCFQGKFSTFRTDAKMKHFPVKIADAWKLKRNYGDSPSNTKMKKRKLHRKHNLEMHTTDDKLRQKLSRT